MQQNFNDACCMHNNEANNKVHVSSIMRLNKDIKSSIKTKTKRLPMWHWKCDFTPFRTHNNKQQLNLNNSVHYDSITGVLTT